MKILAIVRLKPDVAPEQIMPYIAADAKASWELHKSGTIREIYQRLDGPLAVVALMESVSVEAAEQQISVVPAVQAGLTTHELIPLGPYTAWEQLFTANTPA